MRPRWIVVCLVLVWIALAVLVTLVVIAERRMARLEKLFDLRESDPVYIREDR